MARVTYVKKARASKHSRFCNKCRTAINEGDPYKWFATRIGRSSQRKDFCVNCSIRPSDQTTSGNLQTLYVAIENAEDALEAMQDGSLDDYAQILTDAAEGVREASEMYIESADNMEQGFGHETSMSDEIREKGDELESFADELESAADDITGLDDPAADEEDFLGDYEGETGEDDKPVDEEDWATFVQDKRDERREAASEAVSDALSNCPM